MTLFLRSELVPEFAAHSHLRLTSRRILAARDLTNGINAVMIDCMHGVTTIAVESYRERADRKAYESSVKSRVAPRGVVARPWNPVSVNHLDRPGAAPLCRSLDARFWLRSKLES